MLDTICPHVVPELMLADAGYDSQHNHKWLREDLKIKSRIPATSGRPTAKLPTNKWRWLMAAMFDQENKDEDGDEIYGQRWQVETVMFMIKRRQGESLSARKYQTRRREMGLMALTHNIMILWRWSFSTGHFASNFDSPRWSAKS